MVFVLMGTLLCGGIIPRGAEAASKNSISSNPSVSTDWDFSTMASKPVLTIKNDGGSFGEEVAVRLSLAGAAKWNGSMATNGFQNIPATTSSGASGGLIPGASVNASMSAIIIGDNSLEVVFRVPGGIPQDAALFFPMNVKLSGAGGEQKVTVVPWDGSVSGGTYVYANVYSNPANFTVEVKDIQLGLQGQPAGDITLKETRASALATARGPGTVMWIRVPETTRGITIDAADVEVVEGDLVIGSSSGVADDKRSIVVYIEAESSRASTVKISNVKLTSDRSVPAGSFDMEIGGPALFDGIERYFPNHGNYLRFKYANMITLAPAHPGYKVRFTDGSKKYQIFQNNAWQDLTLDVPAYIEAGRLFVPMRAAAEAMGATSVKWSNEDRQVLISKDGRLVIVPMDKNILFINGTPMDLDKGAQMKESRVFLPVGHLAIALGMKSSWNAATHTATFE